MQRKGKSDLKINKKRVAVIVFGFVLTLIVLFNFACDVFFMNEHMFKGSQGSLLSLLSTILLDVSDSLIAYHSLPLHAKKI